MKRGLWENYTAANRGHFSLREWGEGKKGGKKGVRKGGREGKSVSLWGQTMSPRS